MVVRDVLWVNLLESGSNELTDAIQ